MFPAPCSAFKSKLSNDSLTKPSTVHWAAGKKSARTSRRQPGAPGLLSGLPLVLQRAPVLKGPSLQGCGWPMASAPYSALEALEEFHLKSQEAHQTLHNHEETIHPQEENAPPASCIQMAATKGPRFQRQFSQSHPQSFSRCNCFVQNHHFKKSQTQMQ